MVPFCFIDGEHFGTGNPSLVSFVVLDSLTTLKSFHDKLVHQEPGVSGARLTFTLTAQKPCPTREEAAAAPGNHARQMHCTPGDPRGYTSLLVFYMKTKMMNCYPSWLFGRFIGLMWLSATLMIPLQRCVSHSLGRMKQSGVVWALLSECISSPAEEGEETLCLLGNLERGHKIC